MDLKTQVIILLAVAVGGYAFGRYAQPAKVVVKTETIIKEVKVENKHVITQTKEIKHADGTVETDTTTTDTSKISTKETEDSKTSSVTTYSKPQWKVQTLFAPQAGPVGPLYGIDVEKRLLGPISVGAWGNTDRKYGASLSIEF